MAELALKDGDGGGGFDPRDVTIHCLEQENAEFRAVLRRLLDVDGPEAGAVIAEAEKLLAGMDQIDREDEDERSMEAYFHSPVCDCGAFKGARTSYCPECDAEALARMKQVPTPSNVVSINLRDAPRCGDDGAPLCAACSVPAHELTQVPGCGGPL